MILATLLVAACINPSSAPPVHLTIAQAEAYIPTGTVISNEQAGLSSSGLPWGSTIDTGIPGAPPFKLTPSPWEHICGYPQAPESHRAT